jgi:hypothetical protein
MDDGPYELNPGGEKAFDHGPWKNRTRIKRIKTEEQPAKHMDGFRVFFACFAGYSSIVHLQSSIVHRLIYLANCLKMYLFVNAGYRV